MRSTIFILFSSLLLFSCTKDEPVFKLSPGDSVPSTETTYSAFIAGDSSGSGYIFHGYYPSQDCNWSQYSPNPGMDIYIDNDTTRDLMLFYVYGGSMMYNALEKYISLYGWDIALSSSISNKVIIMNQGDTIGENCVWSNNLSEVLISSYNSSYNGLGNPWNTTYYNDSLQHAYLGLRKINLTDTSYGWIRFSGLSAAKFSLEKSCVNH